MNIYQLQTPEEFLNSNFVKNNNFTQEELLMIYAEEVATKFAAECVNITLGNKMEVSNGLHEKVDSMYKSIKW